MFDPNTRQKVYDNYSLNNYTYSDIEVVIAKLTELLAEGYTKLDVEAHEDGYGGAELNFNVVRIRLENDKEYANRMKLRESSRKSRYEQYVKLQKEFGSDASVDG
jgi:hypothetical protein